jgi:hypothetical protein
VYLLRKFVTVPVKAHTCSLVQLITSQQLISSVLFT